MARFTLLLRGNPEDWTSLAPDDMQRIMERYMTWDDELRARGSTSPASNWTKRRACN